MLYIWQTIALCGTMQNVIQYQFLKKQLHAYASATLIKSYLIQVNVCTNIQETKHGKWCILQKLCVRIN